MVTQIDVKALRAGMHMSQAQLAEALGVSQSAVCKWERKGVPKYGTSRKLLLSFFALRAAFEPKDRAA